MKLNQFGGSRTDTLIKFILVFFISLLSFSVGTFVGKQFSDSQHRLAQLETDFEKSESDMRETASIPEGQMNMPSDKALTEEDVAKLAEDFVAEDDSVIVTDKIESEEKPIAQIVDKDLDTAKKSLVNVLDRNVASNTTPATQTAPAAATTATAPTTATTVTPDSKPVAPVVNKIEQVAEKVSKGEAPLAPQMDKKTETPQMPKTVAASTVGKSTVQIAAQPSEDLAKNMSFKLKEQGYSAYYVEGQKDGKKWYRVNIGMFQNKKDAVDYAKKLTEKPEFKGAFVKEIVQ